jgi:hypothetical protein
MFETMQVQITPTTRAAVLRFLRTSGDRRTVSEVAEQTLLAWLQQAACNDPEAAQAVARGYQWKSLFLPEGTCVRFDYQRQTYHAEVRGDRIVYQGVAYSPRQLLLHITGTVRNAWRELWLRGPGDFRWHLADTRRHILRRTARPAGIDLPRRDPPHGNALSAAILRARLYRDDLVRSDQPDLSNKLGGGGRTRAGRAGPRDRRYCGAVSQAIRAKLAAALTAPS